jgi:hypothetical protein
MILAVWVLFYLIASVNCDDSRGRQLPGGAFRNAFRYADTTTSGH